MFDVVQGIFAPLRIGMRPSESGSRGPGEGPEVPFRPSLIFQTYCATKEAQVAPCSTNIFFRL
jgi:hypothetical protein